MKKLERFIGGTNESTNENTSIRYAFYRARVQISPRAPPARHCQTADPAELQHRYFFAHEKGNNESLRGPTSRAGMTTTIWRPRVRIDVPDVGDAENTDTRREELTKKGTKRKYAPRHYGPCEHGVKYRSKCKVCSACPHGRRRRKCKECGGSAICEHGRVRLSARSAVGASICEHGRQRSQCKECGGCMQSASTVVERSTVQGVRWGINLRARSSALYMQGVRWVINLRARSSAHYMQGVRWVINLRARSSALSVQGVRWVTNL